MGKHNEHYLEGQLDLFSNPEEAIEQSLAKETVVVCTEQTQKELSHLDDVPESPSEIEEENSQEVIFRPFPAVQVGDVIQVSSPIDISSEAIGYFDYHKGRKGTVVKVVENSKPLNKNYQFYATVVFKNGEEGVFYDLELNVIN